MIVRCLLAWLCLAAFCVAAEMRKAVAYSGLPAAVQNTIAKLGGSAGPEVMRVEEDGVITFEMEVMQGGHGRDVSVREDGALLRIEVTLAETTAAVQSTIKAQVGAGTLVGVDKIFEDGGTSYEVVMTTKDGQERGFTVEENGTISSLEVALVETPPAVQKTITAQVGAGRLGTVTRVRDEGTIYDVEASTSDGKPREFSVGSDGRLLSIRVTLEETSPEVQRTIRGQIGTGKILRIDKSFERRSKTLPYEVEGMKNGKPFFFSVGAAGKFLGLDD
jgi:hypothetical protein